MAEHVVDRARQGDRGAQRALFDAHHPRVMARCLVSAGGDRDEAKDLAQETFARAFRGLATLRNAEVFSSWLLTIADNVCRTRGRQRNRRDEVAAAFALERDAPEETEPLLREARVAVVQRLLDEVQDPELQEIVKMRYTEPEHTTQQIADAMGLPLGTITSKLLRFRAHVRRDLARKLLVVDDRLASLGLGEAAAASSVGATGVAAVAEAR